MFRSFIFVFNYTKSIFCIIGSGKIHCKIKIGANLQILAPIILSNHLFGISVPKPTSFLLL